VAAHLADRAGHGRRYAGDAGLRASHAGFAALADDGFTVLTLSQMGNALATRSERESLFRQGLFSNLYLFGAVLLTVTLQLILIYVPFFNDVFKTAPLSAGELAACLVLSGVVFVVVELEKWFARRSASAANERKDRRSAKPQTG